MTTLATEARQMKTNFRLGDRVTIKGRLYQLASEPFIDTAERNKVDWRGLEVAYCQPVNVETQRAWQAARLHLTSTFNK